MWSNLLKVTVNTMLDKLELQSEVATILNGKRIVKL